MDLDAFRKDLARRGPQPLTLLAGEEPYLKDRAWEALKEAAGNEGKPLVHVFEGLAGEHPAIWQVLETRPLTGSRVVARVKEGEDFAAAFGRAPEKPAAKGAADSPPPEPKLVRWVRRRGTGILLLDGGAKAWKGLPAAILERAVLVETELDPRSVLSFITRRAAEVGVQLGPGAGTLLRDLVGANLRRLDEALEKLRLYLGKEGPATAEDIQALTPDQAELKIFDLTDAVAKGDFPRAARAYHKLRDQKHGDEQILGTLNWQLKSLFAIRRVTERGGGLREVQSLRGLRMPPFKIPETAALAGRLSAAGWAQRLGLLREADLHIKTGRLPGPVLLTALLYRLCAS